MSTNNERLYSYSYLFGITAVYSGCAVGVFAITLYLSEQLGDWQIYLLMPEVGMLFSLFVSILAQQMSKVKGVGKCILLISGMSSILFYLFFFTQSYTVIDPLFFITLFLQIVILVWLYDGIWVFLTRTEIRFKKLTKISCIVGIAVAMLLVLFVYSSQIFDFFDRHQWVMTFIGIVATLLGGIIIGRRTKKS